MELALTIFKGMIFAAIGIPVVFTVFLLTTIIISIILGAIIFLIACLIAVIWELIDKK